MDFSEPILSSAKPTAKARNLLVIGLFIAIVGYYLLFGSVQQEMVRWFGWIFFVCALLCFYGIIVLNSVKVYQDRIEITYLFLLPVKTILRTDIQQWEEKEMRGQTRSNNRPVIRTSYILILHTASGKVRFPSLNYDKYDQLKAELTRDKQRAS
jgi:hypothetical protein